MNPDRDKQDRRNPWPFPGDSPLARARRVAHMYRARLRALSVDACDELDAAAAGFGEKWVVPRIAVYDDKSLLGPADAADYLCVTTDAIRLLRTRGRLPGTLIDGVWHYRIADLEAAKATRPRTRS